MKTEILLLTILSLLPLVSSAHWIVGYVEDAFDSTSPNGRTISLINLATLEEMFGLVGPSGASGTSNIYMMDCEMMPSGCSIGNILNLSLVDDGSGYNSQEIVQVIVTGAGFDVVPNISMTMPFVLTNITVDDTFSSPENEIDLTSNSTTKVFCTGTIETPKGIDSVEAASATLFASTSSKDSPDDNNDHYTNNSCIINTSYGDQDQGTFNCSFLVQYYANSDTWTCTANATDNESTTSQGSDTTFINPLLSIWVSDSVNFSTVDVTTLSEEKTIQIINLGNTKINLSVYGYGASPGDGNSMICTNQNLTITDTKYNLTSSTPGIINPADANLYYANLTSNPVVGKFGLNNRQNDFTNDAINNTYWRVYVEKYSLDTCQGNIIIGATLS